MGELSFDAVVFDLDGVITRTAKVHSAAWKQAFDEYLRESADRDGTEFLEFTRDDYLKYVDGKPRYEGVRSFLESRGISLPMGTPEDGPDEDTICGIGNRKNARFRDVLASDGVEVYGSTVEFVKKLRAAGVHVGIASSSKNCESILDKAGLSELFETRVDGVVSAELGLNGKPEGDIFIRAASDMGVHPSRAVVVEDAESGVAAGRNGGFALVLGIAREGNIQALFDNGADMVVSDMSEISVDDVENWFRRVPPAMEDAWESCPRSWSGPALNPAFSQSARELLCADKKPVFFLDYDGTLTPIVSRPEDAKISQNMRNTVMELCGKFTVAIVSGRAREDVQALLGIEGLIYAGSHGFDILGPDIEMINPDAKAMIPVIKSLRDEIYKEIGDIEGVIIEYKKFSFAVHYRLADEEKHFEKIRACCQKAVSGYKKLRLMHGKKVFEILPAFDWDKGKAVRFIVKALGYNWHDAAIVYIGDDTTDADAYRVISTRGVPVHVCPEEKPSPAYFKLRDPDDVQRFFEKLIM